jgi:hypothetical protein
MNHKEDAEISKLSSYLEKLEIKPGNVLSNENETIWFFGENKTKQVHYSPNKGKLLSEKQISSFNQKKYKVMNNCFVEMLKFPNDVLEKGCIKLISILGFTYPNSYSEKTIKLIIYHNLINFIFWVNGLVVTEDNIDNLFFNAEYIFFSHKEPQMFLQYNNISLTENTTLWNPLQNLEHYNNIINERQSVIIKNGENNYYTYISPSLNQLGDGIFLLVIPSRNGFDTRFGERIIKFIENHFNKNDYFTTLCIFYDRDESEEYENHFKDNEKVYLIKMDMDNRGICFKRQIIKLFFEKLQFSHYLMIDDDITHPSSYVKLDESKSFEKYEDGEVLSYHNLLPISNKGAKYKLKEFHSILNYMVTKIIPNVGALSLRRRKFGSSCFRKKLYPSTCQGIIVINVNVCKNIDFIPLWFDYTPDIILTDVRFKNLFTQFEDYYFSYQLGESSLVWDTFCYDHSKKSVVQTITVTKENKKIILKMYEKLEKNCNNDNKEYLITNFFHNNKNCFVITNDNNKTILKIENHLNY